MRIVDMRLRPPMGSWTDKPQYKEVAGAYVPTRLGFPRPPSALNRSVALFAAAVNMGDKELPAAKDAYGTLVSRLSRVPGVRSPT